jgi:hypothetical protein
MKTAAVVVALGLLAHPLQNLAWSQSPPLSVRIQKETTGWVMRVDGKPFYIKGVGCNDAQSDGVDYLGLVAETGANTVRIYGDATEEYLDLAARHGLKVNVGFWTNAIRKNWKESYRDPTHTANLKEKALAYVRRFKNHPAVLTWTMGNETFIFSEKEEEREAYGYFLEDLVQAIHKEDPNHPVIYSSSYTRCLPYLKRLVPSIDIVGVNVTGGAGSAIAWAEKNEFDRPVIVTEFAPLGAWEMRHDPNDMPYDPFDHMKADTYLSSWRQMQDNQRSCIGGFAFVMGAFRNQDSLTWYNMNYGGLKRAGFWTVREIYTGQKPTNRPPKITGFLVTPVSGLRRKTWTSVRVDARDADHDPLQIDYMITNIANDPLIVEKPIFYPTAVASDELGMASVQVPNKKGIFRIYTTVKDGQGNIAIANRTIKVK